MEPRLKARSRPGAWSRLAGLAVLALLSAGGLYLAHALAGDWQTAGRPQVAHRDGLIAQDQAAAQGRPDGTPDGADELAAAVLAEMEAAKGSDRPAIDGRAWLERIARAGRDAATVREILPPPPGATRLLGLPGGMTFYRLAAGDPANRIDEASAHYRRALAADGWAVEMDAPASNGGRLLMAARGGRTVAAFVSRREAAAFVLVRLMVNR